MRGDYPPDWPAIAREVKDAAGWCCIRCQHPHNPGAGRTLTVHHLDGDKSNVARWNLAALCQVCHLYIQSVYVVGTNVSLFILFEPWLIPFEHRRLIARGYQ